MVFTWGPGKPFLGHPKGWPSWSRRVYSCSIPEWMGVSCAVAFTGCIEQHKNYHLLLFWGSRLLTKPWVVVLGLLHHLCTLLPLVSLCLLLVVLVCLTHHHDVLATSGMAPFITLDITESEPTWRGLGRIWQGEGRYQSWILQPVKCQVEADAKINCKEMRPGNKRTHHSSRLAGQQQSWDTPQGSWSWTSSLRQYHRSRCKELGPWKINAWITKHFQNGFHCILIIEMLPGTLVKFHVLVQYGLVGLGVHLKRQQWIERKPRFN